MKTRRRLLSLSLCLALALTAFGFPAAQAEAAGGYVEQDFTAPEGYDSLTAPVSTPEGGMAMAGKRADTGAWELLMWSDWQGGFSAMPLAAAEGEITAISIAPDWQIMATVELAEAKGDGPMLRQAPDGAQSGGMSVQGGDARLGEGPANDAPAEGGPRRILMGPNDMKTTVIWFAADGSVAATFQIDGMTLSVHALSGQRTASLGIGSGVDIYDAQGSVLQSISRSDVFGLAAAGDHLVLMQAEKVSVLDAETGKELRSAQISQDFASLLAGDPHGNVYLVGGTGIYRLDAQGDAFEKVSESTGFMIGDPEGGLSAVCALGDGSLAAYFSEGGVRMSGGAGFTASVKREAGGAQQAELLVYRYEAALDLSDRTPFAVTALRDSSKLRKAVSDFQRAHPELLVTLRTQLSEYDYDTPVEDAIRTLNTDLLAGKGGDVLILDELPLAKYIEKGVLMPLNAVLDGIDFLPGIREGSRSPDGNIYAMPAQFTVQTLWGAQEAIEGIRDLASLGTISLKDFQSVLSARTPEDWLRLLYPGSEAAFRDAQGKLRFDTPEFEAFLESLCSLYSAQVERVDSGEKSPLNFNLSALAGMQTGAVALYDMTLGSTTDVPIGYTAAGADENAALSLIPSVSGAGAAYTPVMLAGVSALTAQSELAAEFLRSLYAPALQEMEQAGGLPTVAASLEKLISDAKARNEDSGIVMAMMISDGENTFEMKQPISAVWDALHALLRTVNQPVIPDETLMGFMVDETAAFFEGRDDAAQAAWALEQRAAAYLGE